MNVLSLNLKNALFYLQQNIVFLFDVWKCLHFFIDECSELFEMRLLFKRGVLWNSVRLFNNHFCWNVSLCFVNVFSNAFLIFVRISRLFFYLFTHSNSLSLHFYWICSLVSSWFCFPLTLYLCLLCDCFCDITQNCCFMCCQ